VLLFLEFLDLRGCVLLIDTALSAKPIDICQFVYSKGVSFVEGDAIETLAGSNSLRGSGVFNESKSIKSAHVG
jgi:hypothetical protein